MRFFFLTLLIVSAIGCGKSNDDYVNFPTYRDGSSIYGATTEESQCDGHDCLAVSCEDEDGQLQVATVPSGTTSTVCGDVTWTP